jgi:hypothetical protein
MMNDEFVSIILLRIVGPGHPLRRDCPVRRVRKPDVGDRNYTYAPSCDSVIVSFAMLISIYTVLFRIFISGLPTMNSLHVDFENCYGIKKLQAKFDFSVDKAYAIYAPNGSMKSSFATAFQDVAAGTASKDRIFPARVTKRTIKNEQGIDLPKECVLVIRPYDDEFEHSEKTSTLLVNSELRKEYEQLHVDIDSAKGVLLKALREQSGSKRDLEKEISSTFTKHDNEFYRALLRIKDELLEQKDTPYADIKYDTIFDEKVLGFLGTKDFKTAIESYIRLYNELLAASTYFKKGTFNY